MSVVLFLLLVAGIYYYMRRNNNDNIITDKITDYNNYFKQPAEERSTSFMEFINPTYNSKTNIIVDND
jgi:hypothetical protein